MFKVIVDLVYLLSPIDAVRMTLLCNSVAKYHKTTMEPLTNV